MKSINKLFLSLLVSLVFNSCTSQNTETSISIENAECLYEYTVRPYPEKGIVNLKDCEENWSWEINHGWNICKEKGFAYKIEYSENNSYIINTFYSSSGSGEFTHLFFLDTKKNTFELIESIAGGDRCQNGLISEDVESKDNLIYYSQLITPFHLMSWTGRDLPFNSYDDCMVCCCGAAKYKYNPASKKKEFIGIELLLDELEGNDSFSKTYNSFIKQGKRILDKNDIKEFIKLVENR
jgi:hypothetical protein